MDSRINKTAEQPWNKNGTASVLLAVFLGPFTWFYTYDKDAWKAAAGIGIYVTSAVLVMAAFIEPLLARPLVVPPGDPVHNAIYLWVVFKKAILAFIVHLCIAFMLWVWAITDIVRKPKGWYNSSVYRARKKSAAVLLAVFLGPWTWLYTYSKDRWRFWAGAVLAYAGISWAAATGEELTAYGIAVVLIIWAGSIAGAALRSGEWYANFGENSAAGIAERREAD